MLSKKLPVVRSIDIANEMGYKKSSVSIAMKNLRESEHIRVTKEGYIYLTDSGREIAEMIYERHQILSSWLIQLGVNKQTAEAKSLSMPLNRLYLNSLTANRNNLLKKGLKKSLLILFIFQL